MLKINKNSVELLLFSFRPHHGIDVGWIVICAVSLFFYRFSVFQFYLVKCESNTQN